jgi:multicomponent Na+:H+ antiporter subunit D
MTRSRVTMYDISSWSAWTILLPLAAAVLTFLFERGALYLGLGAAMALTLPVGGVVQQVVRHGPQRYSIGGWGAPLGIDLYADGLAVFMLAMTWLIGIGVSFYAAIYFPAERPSRKGRYFWPLWMFLWCALNGLFLSGDAFNVYVTLELLGLSAVMLVALAGDQPAYLAAMRYLLVSLLGSFSYLLGVVFLYAAFGTLDLISLGHLMTPGPVSWSALTLVFVGVALKTALFPFHFWLPPAHANAPAPVSAILSGLVVKAPFYLMLRFWFWVLPMQGTPSASKFLGILGAAAILWGSIQALRADRLKLLLAYSTVAQLGYLFLLFPLTENSPIGFKAWSGVVFFAFSHGCAKAGLFLATGSMMYALRHDRIAAMEGLSRCLPSSTLAFGIAGASLMGLPPSGGFMAKWLLIEAAIAGGQWWWAIVILGGSLLTAAYIYRVISIIYRYVPEPPICRPVPRAMEWAPLVLAFGTLLLGLIVSQPLTLLQIGAPMAEPVSGRGIP